MAENNQVSRMYIHRRLVVRFLIALLVVLSLASFVSIGFGLGLNTATTDQEDSNTPTKLADTNPFYVLLVGSDSLEGTALYTGTVDSSQSGGTPQADALVLARIDPGNCVVTLVTVPSNTVLEESGELVRDTLTADSPKNTVRAVESISGVDIRYWFLMDFSAFEALVSQIGGVQVDVPVSITMQDPLTAKTVTVPSGKGVQLDEAGTLIYLRSTDPYLIDADPHRQLNVRTVLSQMMLQVLGMDDDGVRKALGLFEGEVETNIDNATLLSLVTRFYDEKESVQVYSCTGPYLASAVNAKGEPVVEQRLSSWRELMNIVDSGEDPASVSSRYNFTGSATDYVKEKQTASSSASTALASSTSSSASSAAKSSSSSSGGDGKKSSKD